MTNSPTEERVLAATSRYLVGRGGDDEGLSLEDAVCQDLLIFGVDVEDYVEDLEADLGPLVWTVPWAHYTDQTGSYRGLSACLLAPILIPWFFIKKVVAGPESLRRPHPREYPHRLTLREVAAAVDAGGWRQDPIS